MDEYLLQEWFVNPLPNSAYEYSIDLATGYRIAEVIGGSGPKSDLALANLLAAAPKLSQALLAIEWIPDDDIPGRLYCPWCENYRRNGHTDDCARQLALSKARGDHARR